MVVSETPNPGTRSQPEEHEKLVQMRVIRSMTIIIGAVMAVAALFLGYLAFTTLAWQYWVQAAAYAITSIYAWIAITRLYHRSRILLWIGIFSVLFGISLLFTAMLLENMGIPCAVVFLLFSLIVSSSIKDEAGANRSVMYGIILAAAALLASIAPLPRMSTPITAILTPAVLGILFMIYVVMVAMQFVASSMRIRLVTLFIAIVIVPLAILSFVQSRFMASSLRDQTNQQLLMAARQTTDGVEKFIRQTNDQFTNTGQIDIFTRYLALPIDQRDNSPEEAELRSVLRILNITGSGNQLYIPSYALIDNNGYNVFDTASNSAGNLGGSAAIDPTSHGKGSYEGDQEYF